LNPINIEPGGLRSDLLRIADTRMPRRWTIIDAISGRISRLTKRDWEQLQQPPASGRIDTADALVAQASAAGLLRRRTRLSGTAWWTMPLRLLAFRVPLFSIDRLAARLVYPSAVLFSSLAIFVWSFLILLSGLSVIIGWSRAAQSVEMLYASAGSNSAITSSTAIMFVLIKCIHELGHGVACRRLGVPVGDVGIFFFCGMPCPYCDVSQVWRMDSRLRRAVVMMAGVYTELIVASLATLIWWLCPSGPLHCIAMNTMILCSVSAIIFNINPLMKLDGYYVLSDALGTPNLRRQASLAWETLVLARFSGQRQKRAPLTWLTGFLTAYHLASTAYRFIIAGVIAMLGMSVLGEWELWWIGVGLLAMIVMISMIRFLRGYLMILKGQGIWMGSSLLRRFGFVVGTSILLISILCFPNRSEVKVAGWLDVQDAISLYVPDTGWVDSVRAEYGDRVQAGDTIAIFRDDDLKVQLAGYKTKTSIASLESDHLKRKALRNNTSDVAWRLDHAAVELAKSQYELLKEREARLRLSSPITGVLLPVQSQSHSARLNSRTLHDREGAFEQGQACWCRVGEPEHLAVHLRLTAKQRQQVRQGDYVKLSIEREMTRTFPGRVDSVDEIPPSERLPNDETQFIVKCRLPVVSEAEKMYGPIGASVEASICIDHEPLWRSLQRSLNEFVNAPVAGSR
jgi:putative peptide zinc metalloprotease protein